MAPTSKLETLTQINVFLEISIIVVKTITVNGLNTL